jgi:hypothetical protein
MSRQPILGPMGQDECSLLAAHLTPIQLEYKTGGPSLPSHLYTEEMLRAAFAVTEILELRAYDADLTEGMRHRGRSALIGMVTRRI